MYKTRMNKYRMQMVESLSALISKKSVKSAPSLNMPYGKGVFSALIYMLDLAEKLDLESINLFGHMGAVSYGKGSETLAILTHLDVVPGGDGWDTDPFKAEIKDNVIYGRGTVDDKGAAIASLYALYALKENCITLNKKVVLLFGCDEESGWADIDFFKSHYPDPTYVISPDASFPIFNSEKGLLHIEISAPVEKYGMVRDISAGTRVNIVPAKARAIIKADDAAAELICGFESKVRLSHISENGYITVNAEGESAHGAWPENGVNALTHLIKALRTAGGEQGDIERFIFRLDDLVGTELDGKTLGIDCSDEISGALSVNVGVIKVENGRISAQIDIRLPISANVDEISEKLEKLFAENGMAYVATDKKEPHHVDEDNAMVQALKKVYGEMNNEEAKCLCCSGATYARAFKNGIAFGPVDEDKAACEHGPNEYIAVDDLVKLSDLIARAIMEIAAAPGDVIF